MLALALDEKGRSLSGFFTSPAATTIPRSRRTVRETARRPWAQPLARLWSPSCRCRVSAAALCWVFDGSVWELPWEYLAGAVGASTGLTICSIVLCVRQAQAGVRRFCVCVARMWFKPGCNAVCLGASLCAHEADDMAGVMTRMLK